MGNIFQIIHVNRIKHGLDITISGRCITFSTFLHFQHLAVSKIIQVNTTFNLHKKGVCG